MSVHLVLKFPLSFRNDFMRVFNEMLGLKNIWSLVSANIKSLSLGFEIAFNETTDSNKWNLTL